MRLVYQSIFITFLLGIMLISACSINKHSQQANPDDLDKIIREASTYLNENIPSGSKVVVINIETPYNALSDYIIKKLEDNAVNDRIFIVVDRVQQNLIATEQRFQTSGNVADDQAVSIGKQFGAQTIISGQVSSIGDN